jgi:HD-like signal output (HDOD) protein
MVACPRCNTPAPESKDRITAIRVYSCKKCYEAYLVQPVQGGFIVDPAVPPMPLAERVSPGSVMEGVFACLDESIKHLPTVPQVPQRVISAIHDPITTTEDLAQLINEDAVFSMRVLHVANSVTYGGRSAITDLRRACARLGTRNLANIAYLVAQGHLYRSVNPVFAELMEHLWRHSVATARLAETFAGALRGVPANSVFLMALTHDIGKPVLLDAITNRYKGRVGRLKESWDLLLRTLDEFGPYSGLRVVQHWNLVPEVRFATFYSAEPKAAPEPYRKCALLIGLASTVAEACGYGVVGRTTPDIETLAAALAQELGVGELGEIMEAADSQISPYLDLAHA